jgi:hypothetical protein
MVGRPVPFGGTVAGGVGIPVTAGRLAVWLGCRVRRMGDEDDGPGR